MRNNFQKRPSGASLHTFSECLDVPVGFVTPLPSFETVFCFICGRWRVDVARYRTISLVLVKSHKVLFPLPYGAGSTVPSEMFNLKQARILLLENSTTAIFLSNDHFLYAPIYLFYLINNERTFYCRDCRDISFSLLTFNSCFDC